MKIAALGDQFTIQALRLMGIDGTVAATAEEAAAALDDLVEPDTVILVTESAANLVRAKVEKLKIARQNHVVLEIPSLSGVPHQAEDIARLVSQAIGVKV